MSAQWFLSHARSLETLISTDADASPHTYNANRTQTSAGSCDSAWLAAREAVACCAGTLSTMLHQSCAPSRADVWLAMSQTQAALRQVETCVALSSRGSTTSTVSQEDDRDKTSRLRVYSEVGVRCAELLVLSEIWQKPANAGLCETTAQRLRELAERQRLLLQSQVSRKPRVRRKTKNTWKRCYMTVETARRQLFEQTFARAMYQRMSNIKVRDLLYEVAEVLKPFELHKSSAYENMAEELNDLSKSGDWGRRYPCEKDMQDILEEAISDLQNSHVTRRSASVHGQFSCMDWLGLSVADANRLRRVFNAHSSRIRSSLGLPVSRRTSFNTVKNPSTVQQISKDSFEETTRQLEDMFREAEVINQESQISASSGAEKKLWVSDRLWTSAVYADSL